DQLYDVRLSLATEGIPRGGGAGFELFDQQKLGSTEFVQKINYQRALQGELARTISQINEVMESRVHLALPEESLFLEDRKPPSAAVVLKLAPGSRLNQRQVQGIVHLVANAVKGLDEDHITILSTDGQVIYKKSSQESSLQVTGSQLELKNQVEENLRQKIQSMLESVIGSNRVIARVTADLDFSQIRTEQDTFDPDATTIRSQQRSVENTEGAEPSPKGNPDVPINIESKLMETPAKDKEQKKFNRQRETVNYEINRVSRKTVNAPGTIKKLSVAVIVDGPYETKAEGGKDKLVFTPRTADEMKGLEDLVKKAVGFDEGRNDQVTVSNVPFASEMAAVEEPGWLTRILRGIKSYQKYLWNVGIIILVFLLVVRPLLRRLKQLARETELLPPGREAAPGLPGGEGGLPEFPLERLEIPVDSLPRLRERALALIKQDPNRARDVLRAWLREM
ncbi:MAG TPA: flagellar M-ring protein FliF, partial [Syntrophobacteraceae bacterium]|nr:flagellar M-ring protein FliF [Syntrophobacteraceae bacterium]